MRFVNVSVVRIGDSTVKVDHAQHVLIDLEKVAVIASRHLWVDGVRLSLAEGESERLTRVLAELTRAQPGDPLVPHHPGL